LGWCARLAMHLQALSRTVSYSSCRSCVRRGHAPRLNA
jgi:hypothetical protein